MPFQSQKQRAYFYSQLPELAKKWEAETPKGKKLPEYKHKEKSALRKYFEGQRVKS